MKKFGITLCTVLLAAASAGCSSAYYSSAGYAGDDLYVMHDKAEIARRQQAEAEAKKAEAEARRAQWEAMLAEARASAAENGYYEYDASGANSYQGVLADSYESAYARRLKGFESPSYKMPSSYSDFRYGSAFNYVSAYDPAFYNIVISGDQVWVEPKYITSMFGTWGGTVYPGGWGFGWNPGPSYWWGYPSYGWAGWNWGIGYYPWYDPWYNPWWNNGWYGPGWAYRKPHNYRLDSYNGGSYRGNSYRGGNYRGGSSYNSGRTGSYNSNRGGSYNSNRGGSYNSNRGGSYNNNRGGSYNSGRGDSYNSNRNNSYNGNRNNSYNSGRSDSYNSGRSESYNSGRSSYNSGGSYSGGSYGGGGGSSRGGGSYNRGR